MEYEGLIRGTFFFVFFALVTYGEMVTPDMHRVHHSVLIRETNSNFGFNFPYWDRLFGTYRPQPARGHEQMTIGLSQFRNVEQVTFLKLLALPFSGEEGRYSLKYIGKDPEVKK